MSRRCTFECLAPEKQARVLAVVRANRHLTIDAVRAALIDGEGIDLARSTLHRMITKISSRDQILARADEQTIVTVVDRVSGEVRVIRTSLPGDLVEALVRQGEAAPF